MARDSALVLKTSHRHRFAQVCVDHLVCLSSFVFNWSFIVNKSTASTRTHNAASAKTKTAKAVDAQYAELHSDMHEAAAFTWQSLVPSPKAIVVQLLARVALYALGAAATNVLTGMLVTAAFSLTGSAFLSIAIYVFGMVLGVLASFKFSDVAVDYIAAGNVSRDIGRAKNWITDKCSNAVNNVRNLRAA